ncbi:exodeoxyribonuclease V subunit alpha [Bermanella sp. WJH001]|uniref:exodeoxyribonuclease V subunit alpha n=1 Tax=Bermanella sp. WJH001 TaxID=3048005 RepID=UPI0024BDED45|nr:exodeoxyribonuclease V subunit alpha [Bermanella sp. WJH001]MDJ1539390.1 exodeoxyribonuclease V subunit alpha [Bermanella sp. WJH001]
MITLSQYLLRLEDHDIRLLDQQFAQFLQELEPDNGALAIIGFSLSAHLGRGHVCLDFSQPHEYLTASELHWMKQALAASNVVMIRDSDQYVENAQCPLVLDGERLYLQRYWLYEKQLELAIRQKLKPKNWDLTTEQDFIRQLFELNPDSNDINWQALAACMAATQGFCVISGGPGTGKTTTVIRLLALLIQLYQTQQHSHPIIKLVAPTGKAAMRLTESISSAKQALAVDDSLKNFIPEQASTVHRLLKSDGKGAFKYNGFNPLHVDVLIVDEASMVDLPLMAKLLDALPEHAQLILLGDKDQLASVEAGSVLADICDSEIQHGYSANMAQTLSTLTKMDLTAHIETTGSPLRDHICHLRKSYRFDAKSGIGHLSVAANSGDFNGWQNVVQQGFSDLHLSELTEDNFQQFITTGSDHYSEYIQTIYKLSQNKGLNDEQAREVHLQFNRFQILCAIREGRLGVAGLNEVIEARLKRKGIIEANQTWYFGRPVMIMQNDYGLNLYNGDIGLVLPQLGDDGKVRAKVVFIGTDQQVRWLQPSRLPAHETVFAMTVHKSQGSEFEHCAVVLPEHNTQVLTKELIYTGITRAKKQLTCIGKSGVIQQALKRKVQRASGLRERLWQIESNPKVNADKPLPEDDSQFSLF